MTAESKIDPELEAVAEALRAIDPNGLRTARVLRNTFDQLYDGQRTGRYRWDQLFKTEKTHCGTLVEINLQREFRFEDGVAMDFRIAGTEVDCKYSQSLSGWMIPPEASGHLCMLLWAEDTATPSWSLGLVRITPERLNAGSNRDGKKTLNEAGRASIKWLWDRVSLPANVLLQMDREVVDRIMLLSSRSGAKGVNELFRSAQGRIVGRAVVATVAQQDDYMKRLRANGGARSALKPEGIILIGHYRKHASIAEAFGLPVPILGETISVRVAPSEPAALGAVEIEAGFWRLANLSDPAIPAPELPKI